MAAKSEFSKVGFIKSSILPLLMTFLIPGFGLWFFNHVESSYDRDIRETVINQIRQSREMTEEQRKEEIAFYERVSVSRILASNRPEVKPLQEIFHGVQSRYAIFRWMKRIATVCLLTGLGVFVLAGIGVLFSSRSQSAQYWSLRLAWNVLRWFSAIEVVGQGILVVALSFWVTAFWAERYYVKLIVVAALFALLAVALLIMAIFRKLPAFTEFDGVLLKQEAAPSLWQRMSQMAEKLGIAPPDNFFVGIDDNFFVTEHAVKVGGQNYRGRTLFASISLLKTLTRTQADAVLAHELAHFSGEDTIYSRRISPLLGKYMHYLEALYQGGLSRPIFHFMFFFWNLFQFSLNKLRREREFRADRIGAELTSPQDCAQALVRITAYCHYRQKVQRALFEKEENEKMDVLQRIEKGFPEFMGTCATSDELGESGTPHPFDTHPPLVSRLENLGVDAKAVLAGDKALPDLEASWFSAIPDAEKIESDQWRAFEQSFHKAHEESLAWRFKPEGEAEIAHVVKYFPTVQFQNTKGLVATLDYEKVLVSDWDSPVPFSTISGCRREESLGREFLVIDYVPAGEGKKQTRKVKFKELKREGAADFIEAFQHYYGRHMTAKQYHAEKSQPATA